MSKMRRRNRTAVELEKLKADMQSKPDGREIIFLENLCEKMSEVIEDFIEPYRLAATTDTEYQNLIAVAIIAWNAALLPGPQRATFLKNALKALAPETERQTRASFSAFLNELIERKEWHFANNRRHIVNYRVTATPEGMHLSIASSIE